MAQRIRTDGVHRGGRPPINRPPAFYRALLLEYESATISEIAAARGKSQRTILRWLATARDLQAKGVI